MGVVIQYFRFPLKWTGANSRDLEQVGSYVYENMHNLELTEIKYFIISKDSSMNRNLANAGATLCIIM